MRTRRDPNLLTTGEAAAMLHASMDTIARMVDAGELPAERTAGGHRRIPRAAVERLLQVAA